MVVDSFVLIMWKCSLWLVCMGLMSLIFCSMFRCFVIVWWFIGRCLVRVDVEVFFLLSVVRMFYCVLFVRVVNMGVRVFVVMFCFLLVLLFC